MKEIKFSEIEKAINDSGWFFFGDKYFKCPSLTSKNISYYEKNNKLPELCNKCYKALIFWQENYSQETLTKFLELISSFNIAYSAKLNKSFAVFYFRRKKETKEFLNDLENKLAEYKINAKTSWRKACAYYQELKPELWKDERELISNK